MSLIFLLSLIGSIVSCSKKEGEFLTLPVAAEDIVYQTVNYVMISSGDANHRGVALYDETGEFLDVVANFRDPATLGYPRGLLQLGNDNILFALDGTDRLETMVFDSFAFSSFFSGGTLAGNIYDLAKNSSNYIFVIESNGVERFDNTGIQTTPLYMGTTIGGCTLNNPRQMIINANDELLVTSYGNHRILHYDVSTDTPTCLTSTGTVNNPYAILAHSNGDIYYATWSDDQIYRANADGSGGAVIFATNTTILSNPTSIVELPSGNIIVASSATDTVEEFEPDGTYVGTFIRDTQSLNILDMTLITREEIVEP